MIRTTASSDQRRVVALVIAIQVVERPDHVQLGLHQPQLGLALTDLRRGVRGGSAARPRRRGAGRVWVSSSSSTAAGQQFLGAFRLLFLRRMFRTAATARPPRRTSARSVVYRCTSRSPGSVVNTPICALDSPAHRHVVECRLLRQPQRLGRRGDRRRAPSWLHRPVRNRLIPPPAAGSGGRPACSARATATRRPTPMPLPRETRVNDVHLLADAVFGDFEVGAPSNRVTGWPLRSRTTTSTRIAVAAEVRDWLGAARD